MLPRKGKVVSMADISSPESFSAHNKEGGRTSDNHLTESKEQKPANSKNEKTGKRKCGYPIGQFILERLKEKTCLKDFIKLYLRTQECKPTDRAFQKAANALADAGEIQLERNEQLWLIPVRTNTSNREETNPHHNAQFLGRKIAARVHSTHKIKLSMPYKGEQPIDGIEHIFGRYRTARQYIYYRGTCTIGAYRKSLVIWVRNPSGILTPEQRINAKAEGFKVLQSFAKEKNLELKGYLEKVDLSHHVVENDSLNEMLKTKLLSKYGTSISARIGTHVCQTSHPGRVEHEGRARIDRIVRGDQVAEGLEYLTLEGGDVGESSHRDDPYLP
jgi:hypothetical protein